MSTWVLLRGWSREAAHWNAFPDRLREALPGARIVTPDLPGNGMRHGERSPTRIEDMVDPVRAAVAATAPVHVLGLSMGALAGIEWARRYPDEVAGAVLANTSARPFSSWYQRLRPASYPALARVLWTSDALARERAILRLTSSGADPGESVATDWAAAARSRPVSRANALRQLVAAARYRAPVAPPPVPLLVLASAGDRLVDPECSRRLALRWSAPFALHPRAGHDLALDAGPWIAREIARWLARR